MSLLPIVSEVNVDNIVFPPSAKPPGSSDVLFLGGAGVRGLSIDDGFMKFTAIAVYLDPKAVPLLAAKWKGKTAEELMDSVEELMELIPDVVTGPFEKFTHLVFISPLMGVQYTDKVVENCFAYWKSTTGYTDAEAKTIEEFLEIFKKENFLPGHSLFFTHAPDGSYTITFSKDFSIPEVGNAVIESKQLSETVLETIIGKNGVSPAARWSLASRLYELMMKAQW